jgi:hypothetical protein
MRPIDLPGTIAELDTLTSECKTIGNLLLNLAVLFPDMASFHEEGGEWKI